MADQRIQFTLDANDRTASVFRAVRGNMRDLEGAAAKLSSSFSGIAATLGVTLSVGALAAFVKNTVSGLDALNDLKDATGSSIENLSALEDVAARTGTSFDGMATSLVKFNKVLTEAKPGSDSEKLFAGLGLRVKELKALDPAEALRRTAVALSQFADDGNKARVVQELFGKSVREVAPFLKDLAEKGKLVGTVTTEQAEAAEKFANQLRDLAKNSNDAARALVSDLIPALSRFAREFAAGKEAFGGVGSAALAIGLSRPFANQVEGLQFYKAALEKASAALVDLENAAATQSDPESQVLGERQADAARANVDELRKYVSYYEKLIGLTNRAGAGRGFVAPTAGGKPTLPALPDVNKEALNAEQIARLQVEAEEQAAKDSAEAWKAWEQVQLADHKTTTEAWALQWKQVFDEIDAEQERAIEEGQAFLSVVKETTSAANELGLTFASAFEDAIVSGKALSDVIRGLEQDILRMVTREIITKPLADFIGSTIKGFAGSGGGADFIGKAASAIGGFFGFKAGGGTIPAGGWAIAGERGPEIITGPARVTPLGQIGGTTVINVTVPPGTDARSAQQLGAIVAQRLAISSARNN